MTQAPPPAKSPPPFESIGTLLQVITAGGITATVFGLGAMYVQFRRYEVPISLLSLDQAARAGALPTAIFIIVVIYVYLAVRFHSFAALGVATAALLPMLIAAIPFMAVATGIYLGIFAAIIWFYQKLIMFLPIDALSDETLSFIIANVIVIGSVVIGVPLGRWSTRRASTRRENATGSGSERAERAPEVPSSMQAEPSERANWLIISISAAVAPLFVVALYPLRWYLRNLGATELAENVFSTNNILISGVIVFLGVVAFVPVILLAEWRPKADYRLRFIAVGVASVVFIVSLVLYCGWIYPMIPSAFGGGRSESITVWIKAEDLAEDARQRLRPASCAEIGKLVRCDDVDSVPVGDSYMAITTKQQPVLVISRQSVKSFFRSPTPNSAMPLKQP